MEQMDDEYAWFSPAYGEEPHDRQIVLARECVIHARGAVLFWLTYRPRYTALICSRTWPNSRLMINRA